MRHHTRLLMTLGLLAMATPIFAQDVLPPEETKLEAALFWWQPDPAITISSGDLSSDIDFVGDLGVEKERFRELRVSVHPAQKHKIRFAYIPVRYLKEGAILNRTIVFRGTTYNLNLPVNSALNWDIYRFAYEYDIVSGRAGYLGVVADVKYNKLDAQLASPAGSEVTEQQVPVPTIGGIARVYVSQYVSITGEFSGFKFDREDFFGKFYDLDIYGQVNLNKSLAVQGGYRSIKVDYFIADDDENGNLDLKGLYLGGVVRF